ncbi:MAG: hypothetical protein WD795_14495 [Woeseia sp.]
MHKRGFGWIGEGKWHNANVDVDVDVAKKPDQRHFVLVTIKD